MSEKINAIAIIIAIVWILVSLISFIIMNHVDKKIPTNKHRNGYRYVKDNPLAAFIAAILVGPFGIAGIKTALSDLKEYRKNGYVS